MASRLLVVASRIILCIVLPAGTGCRSREKDSAQPSPPAASSAVAAPTQSDEVVARFEIAVARADKLGAATAMAELERMAPGDARLPSLGQKNAAMSWPRELAVDLGEGAHLVLVLVHAGSFVMGSDEADDEKPAQAVTISKSFYLGKCEVTQQQWMVITGRNESHFEDPKGPVEMVNWEDCQGFLERLNNRIAALRFSLPTEAEWEYACRAGTTGRFSFEGTEGDLGAYAWSSANSELTTHPVGTKKPNAWGICDMQGNVWEWCSDWYGPYVRGWQSDPAGAWTGSGRVVRGGAFSAAPTNCRPAQRHWLTPDTRYNDLGFRVKAVAEGLPASRPSSAPAAN